jgi:RHS repeat-associated protein
MNSSTSIRQIIFILAFALMAGKVVAADAPGRYIVILKSRSGPPPDVVRLGGSVTFRQDDEVIVTLPSSALSALKADPLVRYVQNLNGSDSGATPLAGEPEEPTAGNPRKLTPHTLAGNLSWSRQYAFDPSGNITNIDNQQFVYDSLGRLTEMATSGATTESYLYDRYGNQIRRTTSSGTQFMDVTETTNRLSSGYTYDPAGNVISGDSYALSYDALGQAATKSYTATTTFNETYIYSASEERIGVQTSNTAESSSWWYWSVRDEGGKVLRQYKTSANDPTQPALWIEDYVWRDGLLLGGERPAILGGRRHFHLDHLGSPRLITSDSGQIVSSHDYLPFGGESSSISQEGPSADGFDREEPLKFIGHERDYAGGFGREDGHAIDYMHARYYSAGISRFLSVDPVEGTPHEPQTWNRYIYVYNNPLNYVDRDGLYPCMVKGSDGKDHPGECVDVISQYDIDLAEWEAYKNDPNRDMLRTTERPQKPCQVPRSDFSPAASVSDNMAHAKSHRDSLLGYVWFYNQVKNHGPMDYKQRGTAYQEFGNFNYGATGAAMGVPDQILLRGAGFAQEVAGTSEPGWGNWYGPNWPGSPFGDDPDDQQAIRSGIQYYRSGCQ